MDNKFTKVAIDAALKSGRFIKSSVGKVKKISYKGRINIVTDVDKRSEEIVIARIRKSFPDHSILSEERKPDNTDSPYKWIIDPIDGTTNFAHSFPFFCVSIALEKDGKVILGVVYDPMRNELFCAERNRGAFLNGKKISVSKVKQLPFALLATGFSYSITETKNDNLENFKNFLVRAQAIRRAGSAALDMCYVACGRFDGFWEMDLYPWDCAAAALIVREAKGKVTKFDGKPYTHYDKCVLASNEYLHEQMVSVLKYKIVG